MTGHRIGPVRYATHAQQRPKRVAVPTKATTPLGLPIPVETDWGARCQSPNPTLGYTHARRGIPGKART